MNQSLVTIDEQSFAELAQSIREDHQLLCNTIKSKATSFYTIDNFSSIRNEEFILNYEVLKNNENTSNKNQLLKIENTSFSKLDQSAYCIIVNIPNASVRNRLTQYISKVNRVLNQFSFSVTYFDFTYSMDNDQTFTLSNSLIQKKYDELKQFIEKNQFDCRFLIFYEEFQDRLVKILSDCPFVYCCSKASIIKEAFLEGLKLHQSFYYTDLSYTNIRQIIPTAFSLLQDIIFTNIEIEINYSNTQETDGSCHPLLIIKNNENSSEKKEKVVSYQIPYVVANSYFYLPLENNIIQLIITDGLLENIQKYKYIQNNKQQQEIDEYHFIFSQLKYCHQQLSLQDLFYSIKSEEQFYSVNSIILRDQIKQFNSYKAKTTKENEKFNKICSIIERICSSSEPINVKLAEYFSLRQCLLYRMRNLYFTYQF